MEDSMKRYLEPKEYEQYVEYSEEAKTVFRSGIQKAYKLGWDRHIHAVQTHLDCLKSLMEPA